MVGLEAEQAEWSGWSEETDWGEQPSDAPCPPKKARKAPAKEICKAASSKDVKAKKPKKGQAEETPEAGGEKQVVPPKRRVRGKSADLGELSAQDEGAVDDPPAENATFARRYRPTRAHCLQKWLALRQAYNTRIKPFLTYHGKMEDFH